MVENNEQWDDIEYSDNQETDVNDDNYEYSDEQDNDTSYDDSEEDEAYEDDDEDYEDSSSQGKRNNFLPMIIIFLLLVGVILVVLIFKFGASSPKTENTDTAAQNNYAATSTDNTEEQQQQTASNVSDSFFETSQEESDNSNMMSVNFNEAGQTNVTTGEGENQQVATVTESNPADIAKESDLFDNQTEAAKSPDQENNAIMVVYNKAARSNPFKPPVNTGTDEKSPDFEVLNNVPFEIIEPPKTSVVDENLNRLLKTQISGILYDSVSPSAIVNLNGLDHFVKVGDTISGYTIKSITKDKVQINYKNNSYVASVGELFTPGNLEKQQAVANLQNKFAGRYKN